MSIFFFDTSALAKRYMPETGMIWVRKQTASSSGNSIVIARITPVELYSAISRKYHDGLFDLQRLQAFRRLFSSHVRRQYLVMELTTTVMTRALNLHESHRMRAYDAVQLASALELHNRFTTAGTSFSFITADQHLLQVATTAGLTTDNPNNYP